MITLFFLLEQAAADLSLSQVRALSPEAAGDAILRDQQHGPVESFDTPAGGMLPPGTIEGQLVERAVKGGSVCIRRVWTVRFQAASGTDIGTAKVEGTYETREIALLSGDTCPAGRYVRLSTGISVDQGRRTLMDLERMSAPTAATRFECFDETPSDLCSSRASIRTALKTLKPWAIVSRGGDTLAWLGERGQIVTEVRWSPERPSIVFVSRRIPAPF